MATEILVTGASGIFEGVDLTADFSGVLINETNALDADFAGDGDGSELAFNIIDHLYSKLADQTAEANGANNIRVGTSTSLSTSSMTKNYTFSFDLGLNVGTLNVLDES